MRSTRRLAAFCVGVLLLAAPVAGVCGELGAVTSTCPMMDAMGSSICHDEGQMPQDCCDLQSAPEPMQAMSFESAKRLTALEISLRVDAPLAPAAGSPDAAPAPGFCPNEAGRYKLLSTFLL